MDKVQNKNIILIGFMGSGKTSIGKKLSEISNYQFFDTDHIIETREKDIISNIFQSKGEEYFRQLETDLLRNLKSSLNCSILSTGGGLPLREENAKLLKELGFVVYLKASQETILERLKGDTTRPLLQGEDYETRISLLHKKREPFYENAATSTITTDHRSLDEITMQIWDLYQTYRV